VDVLAALVVLRLSWAVRSIIERLAQVESRGVSFGARADNSSHLKYLVHAYHGQEVV
jgi:hypothetical protein